ncbi:hypothetical protein YSY43_17620 [Paenibacillus sp. YSY-4.3]
MSEVLNKTEMYIERARFQELIHKNIGEMRLDKNIFKNVANFIYSTLIIGFFFSWASASDTSNIFVFLDNFLGSRVRVRYFFDVILFVLLMIPLIAVVLQARDIKRAVIINSLTHGKIYRKFYKDFIAKKLTNKRYSELTLDEVRDLFLSHQGINIEFQYYEFENYINERLSESNYKISGFFASNYTNFILLNECIDGTLIMVSHGYSGKYGEIIDGNYGLI